MYVLQLFTEITALPPRCSINFIVTPLLSEGEEQFAFVHMRFACSSAMPFHAVCKTAISSRGSNTAVRNNRSLCLF
jgi:hypothetical protein